MIFGLNITYKVRCAQWYLKLDRICAGGWGLLVGAGTMMVAFHMHMLYQRWHCHQVRCAHASAGAGSVALTAVAASSLGRRRLFVCRFSSVVFRLSSFVSVFRYALLHKGF